MTAAVPTFHRIQAAARAFDHSAAWITLIHADGSEERLTASQVMAGAADWAAKLAAHGLKPGDRVVICLDHGRDLYLSFLGALALRCVPSYAAAASPRQPAIAIAKALDLLIDANRPRAIVSDENVQLAPRNDLLHIRIGAPSSLPATSVPDAHASPIPAAFIQYSSGTTGAKKGVGISDEMLDWQIDRYAATIGLGANDKIVSWLPLYHDMGLIASYFLPLVKGIPLVAMSPFDWIKAPASLLAAIEKHRATLCWLPNFAYELLARNAAGQRKYDLSSMRMFINCSEPVLARSHDMFRAAFESAGVSDAKLATCYAMAEATYAVTASAPGQPARRIAAPGEGGREIVSSGRPLDGAAVKIIDEHGQPSQSGVFGRVCIRLPSLFAGYLDAGKVNASSLVGGWHHTGDVGLIDGGELFVLGREDDVIIVAGQNIFPQDIEAVVNDETGTVAGRNVAFGVRDAAGGTESIIVMAEVRDVDAARASDLERRLSAQINAAIGVVPRHVCLVPHMSLIKSTSGKISRKLNRQRYLADRATATPAIATPPRAEAPSDIEGIIRAAVVAVLAQRSASVPRFTDSESLFDFGLIDSLSFVDLVMELEQRMGRPVPRTIIDNPIENGTVAGMAALYRAGAPSAGGQGAADKVAARELRKRLVPHITDTDETPLVPRPYIMFAPQPYFTSPSANTDENGFRVSIKNGARLSLRGLRHATAPKGAVFGNSQIWGTGTSSDNNVVHNVLNETRPDEQWCSVALRASSLTQERLAGELYAPLDARHVAWITGGIFLNYATSTLVHERLLPFPFMERFLSLMGAGQQSMRGPIVLEERWPQVLRLFEREIILYSRTYRATAANLIFALQPTLSWSDKPLSPEEKQLWDLFQSQIDRSAIEPEAFRAFVRAFVKQARAICERHRVTFIDVSQHPEFMTPAWLFIDGAHMNDAGHRALARVIAGALA